MNVDGDGEVTVNGVTVTVTDKHIVINDVDNRLKEKHARMALIITFQRWSRDVEDLLTKLLLRP